MSVSSIARWILAVSAIAAGLAVFAGAQPPTPERPPVDAKPVSVETFWKQLPVGYLGVPLGTVVRVTGEAFDGNTTGLKADAGETLLRIMTVNGKELAKPVVFEFGRAKDSVKQPKPGEKFDYYVHEYGEFEGMVTAPKEFGINTVPPFASRRFGYRSHLEIHASNAARK